MAKAKKKAVKIKKKHWFEVIAPNIFGEVVLGETYVTESDKMMGKPLTLNLRGFSSKSGRNNVSIGFEVKEVIENKARCTMNAYNLLPASVKRLASRGKEKISESFLIRTKDGQIARIKIILVTLNKASNSTLTAIRNTLRQFIANKLAKLDYEELIELTIENKVQTQIKKTLSKVYPLRMAAIKSISIEKRRKKLTNVVEAVVDIEEEKLKEEAEILHKKEESKVVEEEKPVVVKEEQVLHNKEEETIEAKPKKEKAVKAEETKVPTKVKKEAKLKVEAEAKPKKEKATKITKKTEEKESVEKAGKEDQSLHKKEEQALHKKEE
ncbi:MAG: hypothetical protein KAQ83_01010 [Nanoarchaeota archaeon]|nr:hypothetical protein [Nanoarchaeota archaeon]